MSKANHDKLSSTLKDAMVRNAMAEQRMKMDLEVMQTDVKKNVQSMKLFQNKYEKRQKELQQLRAGRYLAANENAASRPNSGRKSSAPAFVSVETMDLHSGGLVTAIGSTQVSRQRSVSEVTLPKLTVCSPEDSDEKGGNNLKVRRRPGQHLPALVSRPHSALPLKQNLSASLILDRPRSAMLTVDNTRFSKSKSAPSSPIAPRKERKSPVFNRPASSNRCRSPAMKDIQDILVTLDKVREKKVPDLDSFSNISKWRNLKAGGREDSEEEQVCGEDGSNDETVKEAQEQYMLPGPGTTLSSPKLKQQTNQKDRESLAESMDKIKYCKYLRGISIDGDETEQLPKELIPTSIIVGHSRLTSFSGKSPASFS